MFNPGGWVKDASGRCATEAIHKEEMPPVKRSSRMFNVLPQYPCSVAICLTETEAASCIMFVQGDSICTDLANRMNPSDASGVL